MNNIQTRFILFLFGCILVRTMFVIIAKKYKEYLPLMSVPAFIMASGFFYIYATNSRKTGNEVFGDKIWWDDLRPIHGLLYTIFGILALQKNSYSWTILLVDVIIGLSAFLKFHYINGNFKYLLP
jgi:hypothetical protein